MCPTRSRITLPYYYVHSNISLHPVHMLSCVRDVALPSGAEVVTPVFACVLLRLCAVFQVVRGVMVSRCWVFRLECPLFGVAPCAEGRRNPQIRGIPVAKPNNGKPLHL
jgi:hypothetical protein